MSTYLIIVAKDSWQLFYFFIILVMRLHYLCVGLRILKKVVVGSDHLLFSLKTSDVWPIYPLDFIKYFSNILKTINCFGYFGKHLGYFYNNIWSQFLLLCSVKTGAVRRRPIFILVNGGWLSGRVYASQHKGHEFISIYNKNTNSKDHFISKFRVLIKYKIQSVLYLQYRSFLLPKALVVDTKLDQQVRHYYRKRY